jgi:hypothetical protein
MRAKHIDGLLYIKNQQKIHQLLPVIIVTVFSFEQQQQLHQDEQSRASNPYSCQNYWSAYERVF